MFVCYCARSSAVPAWLLSQLSNLNSSEEVCANAIGVTLMSTAAKRQTSLVVLGVEYMLSIGELRDGRMLLKSMRRLSSNFSEFLNPAPLLRDYGAQRREIGVGIEERANRNTKSGDDVAGDFAV